MWRSIPGTYEVRRDTFYTNTKNSANISTEKYYVPSLIICGNKNTT